MTTAEILEKAAEIIERDGWGQGNGIWPPNGGACLVTGICRAEGMSDTNTRIALWDVVRSYLDFDGPIYEWNDAPGRTQEEVTRMLRGLAAKLSEQPSMVLTDRDCGDEDPSWEVREYQPA